KHCGDRLPNVTRSVEAKRVLLASLVSNIECGEFCGSLRVEISTLDNSQISKRVRHAYTRGYIRGTSRTYAIPSTLDLLIGVRIHAALLQRDCEPIRIRLLR